MDGAGLDHEEVAGLDGHAVEKVVPPSLLYHAGKLLAVLRALTNDDGRTRLAVEHVPALALAEAAVLVLGGVRVVRVHLHGEVLARVQDLDEQREAVPLRAAEELVLVLPEPAERLAVKASTLDCAVSVRVRADGPALAHVAVGDVVTVLVVQVAAAPDLVVEHGLGEQELLRLRVSTLLHVHVLLPPSSEGAGAGSCLASAPVMRSRL